MKNKLFPYLLMHFGFLLFSSYILVGKFASAYEFLSFTWCCYYALVIFIMFIYALIWQQVLKHISLGVATANKAATIIWGLIWSILIFKESITIKQISGVVIIFAGILVLSISDKIEGIENAE